MADLPEPVCRFGYPKDQLGSILKGRHGSFENWMVGQTLAVCDGTVYDHEANETVESGCGPHGAVVYGHDLRRFLSGLAVMD